MNINLNDRDLNALDYALKTTWGVGVKDPALGAILLGLQAKLATESKKTEAKKAETSPEEENNPDNG